MPRKSDPRSSSTASTRRNDVSLATFVLADDQEEGQSPNPIPRRMEPPFAHTIPVPQASVHTPTPKPASASVRAPTVAPITMASSATPVEDMDTDRPSESAPPSDKKGGADSSKDTVAIEVRLPWKCPGPCPVAPLARGEGEEANVAKMPGPQSPEIHHHTPGQGVLPPNTQIQANAILAMTKGATVFINHLASAANERTLSSGKKTILPDDVFEALEDIEYSQFRDQLQAEFKKFNETRTTKRNTYRRRVAAAKKGIPFPADPNASMVSNATSEGATEAGDISTASASGAAAAGEAGSSDQQPRSKKAKTGGAPGEDSQMDIDDEAGGHTEPEDEVDEEDEEEEDVDEANQDEEEGDEDEEEEMQDAMEERENAGDDDEALDNGDDSDA
ncbi:hypothetical protein PG994_010317 [Apiospora phragmitis]|uniref:DNA polymerase epsilon subunit D n=1 Tax=Apiospora phragmitis TaxID=2905665 RepID=A0ABR1TPQ0_9PEZI